MNYIDALAYEITEEVSPLTCPLAVARLYALLALTVGEDVAPEDVHDAWAVWRTETNPDHLDLIPFDKLSPEVQALDRPFADAIRLVASRMKGRA